MLTFTLHTMRGVNRCLPYERSIDLMLPRYTHRFYRYVIVCGIKALVSVSAFYCKFCSQYREKNCCIYVLLHNNDNKIWYNGIIINSHIYKRRAAKEMCADRGCNAEDYELSLISSSILARDARRMHDAKMSRACKFAIKDVILHQKFKLLPPRSRNFQDVKKKERWQDSCFIESNGVLFRASRGKNCSFFLRITLYVDLYTALVHGLYSLGSSEPREFQTAPLGRGAPADL